MEKTKTFLLGILAGMSIAFGGAAFVACAYYGSRILGSILFSCGLLLVCAFGFKLYTGQIGKVFENKKSFIIDLLIMLAGNFVGAVVVGLLASLINPNAEYEAVNKAVGMSKLVDFAGGSVTWYALLIQSLFCGMLVYLGVEVYKFGKDDVTRVIGIILAVAVFVIASYSHCVANMYYMSASRLIFEHFGGFMLSLVISIIGNSIGAIIINLLFRFGFKKSIEKVEEDK